MVDTVITGDGSAGPYVLGRSFVDSGSIRVKLADSSYVPPWVYIADNNAVLFSSQIDSGKTLQISYNTKFYGLPKIYSLYPKVRLKIRDTLKTEIDKEKSASLLNNKENLSVSGYKSISIAAGNLGQICLEQGLDVQIGGELRPGTKLEAHFTDQGSTLDGATREISEFDMIYVTLTDSKFRVVAGDQYLNWPFQGIYYGQKKIKGLSIDVHPGPFSVGVFGALTGGNFTTETWHGRSGLQGPYNLSGKGEQGIITPISGTVKVKVNGKELHEGEDRDFTVDYDLGSITFLPRVPINDNDLMIVDYEYKLFDYQRTLFGTTAGFSTRDSIFSVQGVLWSEADNKNHLIDVTFDSSDMAGLRSAGDKAVFGNNYRSVHENDVPEESRYEPLYVKVDTLNSVIFRYKPFDPKFPDDRSGRYKVYFTYAGKNAGSYIQDTSIQEHLVYKYIGEGFGDYLPHTQLSTPKRLTTGEVTGKLQLDLLKVKINVAGQDFDKNLFSSMDESDNRGSAIRGTVLAGRKLYDKQSVWFSGNYDYSSRYFDKELLNTYDRFSMWDDSSYNNLSVEQQIWDGAIGVTPFKKISFELGYGQNMENTKLKTDKLTYYSRVGILQNLLLDYTGTLFRHNYSERQGVNRKGIARLLFEFNDNKAELSYKDEWFTDSLKTGKGSVGGILNYEFIPWNLKQSFEFIQYRSGNKRVLASVDTGWAFSWKQSYDNQLLNWWKLNGSSSFYKSENQSANKDNKSSSTTFLIDINSEMNPERAGFASSQHYRLSSEKMSTFIQIPVLTVRGQGTHIYNDSLKEYVPHPSGDYLLQQRETYDMTSERVRKNRLDLSWSYYPVRKLKGIINDLNWQGTLLLDEHVDIRNRELKSWLPGVLSLNNIRNPFNDKTVNYADLSYRQEIDWRPKELPNVRGDVFSSLLLKRIRSYQETGSESGISIELKYKKMTFINDVNYCYVFHNDSIVQDFYVRDLNALLNQKLGFTETFDIYIQECIGWARKDDKISKEQSVKPDSCIYVQINPGIQWRPWNRGWVETSYLMSYVPLPGDPDYRMARGMSAGLSHVISATANIQIGKHFSLSGSYRGEMRKINGNEKYEKGEHTVTMEMKAFL